MTVKKEVVKSIKGFDKDLKCSGFQFEFGETYEQEGDIVACKNGFHAVEGHPLEVFKYYAPGQSRYAEVQQSGALTRQSGNSRLASAKITIGVELHLHDLIHRAVNWVFDKAPPENTEHATGDYGAASATGTQGAAMASGYKGAAMGEKDNALFLVHRNDDYEITHAWAGIAGRDGIKAMTWYTLNSHGRPEEVK